MKIEAKTLEEYYNNVPKERTSVMLRLRNAIQKNIPAEFEETLNYGMPGWVVPHSLYPDGYHCNTDLPLPFINIASQKNFIAVYHMGIYSDPSIMNWFVSEYSKHCTKKLDMGKSCIRFKKIEEIPYELIGELCTKISTKEWIDMYEKKFKKK